MSDIFDDSEEFLKAKVKAKEAHKKPISEEKFKKAAKHVSITITGVEFSEAVADVMHKAVVHGNIEKAASVAYVGAEIMVELFGDKIDAYTAETEGED